jgi:hypothetical protein
MGLIAIYKGGVRWCEEREGVEGVVGVELRRSSLAN